MFLRFDVFMNLDIISALSSANYSTGPYGAIAAVPAMEGDGHASIIYDADRAKLLLTPRRAAN